MTPSYELMPTFVYGSAAALNMQLDGIRGLRMTSKQHKDAEKANPTNRIASSAAAKRERQDRFEKVYSEKLWAPRGGPLSGSGSSLEATANPRRAIASLIRRSGVRSILDAPCGDLTWMRDLFPEFDALNVSYTGVDIVRPAIRRLKHEFANDRLRHFEVADLTRDTLPRADLIFSRQALQHMPATDALRALHNFARTGAKYLLTTTYAISPEW